MKIINKIIAVALVSVSACAFADLKVGVVSIQNVFQNAPQGQAAVDKLKQQLSPQAKKLTSQQNTLESAVDSFNRNAPTLSAAEKTKQEQSLTSQQQSFQKSIAAFRKQEGSAQQQAAQTFQNDLVKAINQVAQQGGYDMVMTDQTIPYYKQSFDVTAQVVKLMKGMSS